MTLLTKILIGLAALALGVFLGLPGRAGGSASRRTRSGQWTLHGEDRARSSVHDEEYVEELERELGKEWEQSRKTKRHFTLINWMRKDQRGSQRRRSRRYFRTAAPKREVSLRRRR